MSKNAQFVATLETVLASASVQLDVALHATEPSYAFTLLAAASEGDQSHLPAHWKDRTGKLDVETAEVGKVLKVTLQATGFQAVAELAGKQALLVSDDGNIRTRIVFSQSATATVDLVNSSTIRAALAAFKIYAQP